ncbi:MAG: hypothetical protein ACHP84_13705 [Caulobacterales bacterium]
MKRPALLLLSQFLLLVLGLFFPILFVRYNGHAAFGTVALAATYSAVILSVVVTGLSQSILTHGLAFSRLSRYALALSLGGGLAWLVLALVMPSHGPTVYLAVVFVLAAQSSVSFIYYYAIRRRLLLILTFLMPCEALARIVALVGLHALRVSGPSILIGCYVVSNVVVSLAALALISWRAPAEDPDAGAALRLNVAGRFMRWAVSGTVLDGFDRAGYGAMLPAVTRSPFLFFDMLYLTAFGLIANTARMEVLSARHGHVFATRRALLALVAGGLAASAAATWAVFALGAQLGRWTGFDPRPVAAAVLFAFLYRAALFVQFVAYGYIERGGLTDRNSTVRVVGSACLLAIAATASFAPLQAVGWACLAVVGGLAAVSLWLALQATDPRRTQNS